jgi:hypothetical protein
MDCPSRQGFVSQTLRPRFEKHFVPRSAKFARNESKVNESSSSSEVRVIEGQDAKKVAKASEFLHFIPRHGSSIANLGNKMVHELIGVEPKRSRGLPEPT